MTKELKSTIEFSGHVSGKYDESAQALIAKLEAMGQSADGLFDMLRLVLEGSSADLALVKKTDKDINQLEYDVVADLQVMIGNYSPALDELRFLLSTMPIVISLERLGDIAKANIKRCTKIKEEGVVFSATFNQELLKMIAITRHMLDSAMACLHRFDASMLQSVLAEDDQVDALYLSLMTLLTKQPQPYPMLPILVKNMERAADHALDIARTVHYAHVGKRPKKKHIRAGNVHTI